MSILLQMVFTFDEDIPSMKLNKEIQTKITHFPQTEEDQERKTQFSYFKYASKKQR